jgi:hypothetical protein
VGDRVGVSPRTHLWDHIPGAAHHQGVSHSVPSRLQHAQVVEGGLGHSDAAYLDRSQAGYWGDLQGKEAGREGGRCKQQGCNKVRNKCAT